MTSQAALLSRLQQRLRQPQRLFREGDAQITVGGPAGAFAPEMELRRWDSEWVKLRLLGYGQGYASQDQQAVVWQAEGVEARWYRLPGQRYEFATIFTGQVPAEVCFAYSASRAVEITRQAPLANQAADGSHWGRNPWGGLRLRPAEVVDSYACYVPWSGDYRLAGGWNYQSGKVAHLYRPWIVDAVGRFAWCEPSLEGGILRIRIPAAFRDGALGPCLLDPTFGYSGTAASDDNIGGAHSVFKAVTAPGSAGALTSVTISGRVKGNAGGTSDPTHSPAIYGDNAGVPGTRLAAIDTAGTAYANFGGANAEVQTNVAYGSLVGGSQYWLGTRQGAAPSGVFLATIDAFFGFDASGGVHNTYFKVTSSETAWEADGSTYSSGDNEKTYIFGTFTATVSDLNAQVGEPMTGSSAVN